MKLVRLIFLLLILLVPGTGLRQSGADAADQSDDLRAAQATAEQILELAAQHKFNAMYDRIHPDAHMVVPRAAAVGTFEEIYGATQAGQAQITGAQLVDWTWPVTGKAYHGAAAIAFTQPYVANGQQQQLNDTMYLVKSGAEWRWFFGSSRDFVDAMIAKYGARGTPLTQGDLLQNVVSDLDGFYRDVFSYTSYTYQSPSVLLVQAGDSVQTACGPDQTGFWAFYCPGDRTVYLDEPLLMHLEQTGPFAAAFVIAHEWAHHVQATVGFQRIDSGEMPHGWNQVFSIELELMADCMAGAWTLDVDTRGQLAENDVQDTIDFTVKELGDPSYVGEYDPHAHGTADERVQSFLTGYDDGFLGCNISV
jgi:predicted metalloprotease